MKSRANAPALVEESEPEEDLPIRKATRKKEVKVTFWFWFGLTTLRCELQEPPQTRRISVRSMV